MAMSKGMPAMQQTGFGQQAFGDDVNNNNSFSHNNYNNYNNNVNNYTLSSS